MGQTHWHSDWAHVHADHRFTDVQPVAGLHFLHEHRIGELAIGVARHGAASVYMGHGTHFCEAEATHRLPLHNETAIQMLATLKGKVQVVFLSKTAQHWKERFRHCRTAGLADAFAANLTGTAADDKNIIVLRRLALNHLAEDGFQFASDGVNFKHRNPSFRFTKSRTRRPAFSQNSTRNGHRRQQAVDDGVAFGVNDHALSVLIPINAETENLSQFAQFEIGEAVNIVRRRRHITIIHHDRHRIRHGNVVRIQLDEAWCTGKCGACLHGDEAFAVIIADIKGGLRTSENRRQIAQSEIIVAADVVAGNFGLMLMVLSPRPMAIWRPLEASVCTSPRYSSRVRPLAIMAVAASTPT